MHTIGKRLPAGGAARFVLEMPENGGRLHDYLLTLVNEPLPTQFPGLPEHKNADFVLEKPENEGFEG